MITITKMKHEKYSYHLEGGHRGEDYMIEFNTDPLNGNEVGGFGMLSVPQEVFEAFSVGDRASITLTRAEVA
jgi:hypothetical protein